MPPTRRSSAAVTPTRKTRLAVSNQGRTVEQSSNSVTPRSQLRRKKSSATSEENEPTLQTPDKDGDGHQNEDTSSPGLVSEGTSRRSSRQRTVSKRLQNMELFFGKKKEQTKRESEDNQQECTPSKKTKQDHGEKSGPATADPHQTPACGHREDTENTCPEVVRIPADPHTNNTNTSQSEIPASQPSTDAEHKENKEDADSPVLTEPEQSAQADVSPSTAATEDGQQGVTAEVTPDSGAETSTDMDLSQESADGPERIQGEPSALESEAAVTLSPQQGQPEVVSSSEMQGKQEPGETSGPVDDTCTDPVQHHSCVDDSVTDTDEEAVVDSEKQVSAIDKDDVEAVENNPVTIIDNNTENSTSQPGNQEPESGGTESTATPTEDTDMTPQDTLSSTNKHSESVSETPKDKGNKVDNRSEEEGGESVCVTTVQVQHPTDTTPQFVMLDDGRQLLLSNADALATAADAVASLSQMKEVAFIINNDNGGSTVTGSDGQVQKIKFVTVNTPVLHGTMDNSKVHVPILTQSDVHNCRLDMRITADGQVAAGPATVLSADGFYRCSMCAYKTDKKANWYKHRYTHMAHRRYQCDKCDHQATTSSNLKRHMLIHSDVKVFSCDLCHAEFRQKIHLMRHVKYKHQKKEVKCGNCDYVCANFSPDLLAHIKRRHQCEAESTHRCETCGFTAANSRDLKQHLKFHKRGPELKLYCELCSFVTDCASRLQRHQLVHNKVRPYWCSLCSYRASQKEHVMRHLRTKHKMTISSVYETVEELEGVPVTTIVPGDIPAGQAPHPAQTMVVLESAEEAPSLPQEEGEDAESNSQTEPTISSENAALETSTDGAQPTVLVQLKEQESSGLESEHQLQGAEDSVQVSEEHPPEAAFTVESADTKVDGNEEPSDGVSSARARLAAACSTRLIYAPTQKTVKKKYYPPADFSSREKVFSCIHCTMKFSKLINLYKHMNVQHKDMQTSKADGMHTCVWCEYQTNKWKNLLVHMRKHNYREEYGTVTTRYACVVCTYSSQHRKALYAHMMKKHKVQIYIKPDGSASCVIDDTIPGTMSGTDGSAVVVQRPRVESTPKMEDQSVVVMAHQDQEQEGAPLVTPAAVGVPESHTTQTVMIELEPGMPATAVQILAPHHGGSSQEDVDHEAADAIEGLQALAEQVMAAQHQQDLEEGEVQMDRSFEQKAEPKAEDREVSEEVAGQDEQTQIHIQDCSGQVMEGQNIQLTPEQLMQLTSGDFIEINGEMYKVEVAEEAPPATEESYT